MAGQDPILIRRKLSPAALHRIVQERLVSGETFVVTGYGARARKVLERLASEFPDADVFFIPATKSVGPVAIFNHDGRSVGWYGREPQHELDTRPLFGQTP